MKFTENMNTLLSWKKYAERYIDKLNKKINENVNITIKKEDKIMYILRKESTYELRPEFILGKKYPIYCTALGYVILAGMPEKDLDILLKNIPLVALTPNTITNFNTLEKKIKEVKVKGYAIDNEEFQLGLKCIAAPIKCFGEKTVAAIGISMASVRIKDDKKMLYIKDLLIETADTITEKLDMLL